jgi:hypothetical protein
VACGARGVVHKSARAARPARLFNSFADVVGETTDEKKNPLARFLDGI